MWYKNSYRRHLMDMHINDWGEDIFLRDFDPEVYCDNLKAANIKSAMIYLQSHVGFCHYPTKVGHTHPAFLEKPDAMKRLTDLCHQNNIDVTAYYSINYNNIEAEAHPNWMIVPMKGDAELEFGGDRYGLCCPNNPDYREFVKTQIKEMLEYADFDGLFFDMPFWRYPCHCKHCTEKWKAVYGTEMPNERDTKEWDNYIAIKEIWTGEYAKEYYDYAKSIRPDLVIYYNYACVMLPADEFLSSEVLNDSQDFASGDLYRGFLTQSFTCKYFDAVTTNKPFEYMTGRCDPGLACHTVTKSDDKLKLAAMLTVAHHGANFFIDAIDPKGTMDSRFYNKLGEVYREAEKYEPYMGSGDLIADIGVYYCIEGRGMNVKSEFGTYNATFAASENLIRKKIPFSVFSQRTINQISKYKALIMANPRFTNDNTISKLKKYVENGGILYFSGSDDPKLLKEFLNAEVTGYTHSAYTYLAPKPDYEELLGGFNAEYPLACQSKLPFVSGVEDMEILATITLPYINKDDPDAFASIHSNPPGTPTDYPGLVIKNYGKGKVIWSAAGIEAKTIKAYREILVNLLNYAGLGELSVTANASPNVEIIAFKNPNSITLSAVYITDDEDTEIQSPFEIRLKCCGAKSVKLLPTNEEIPFIQNGEFITFKTRELNIFDMYEIRC
ncbi:MAG: alpha-L-fucosidase [Clostridia bacterium]|nr:alpha-L-fucosidase [Clostridia bacterium]